MKWINSDPERYSVAPEKFVVQPETYRVGTLQYTRIGLIGLFGVLYFGVFALISFGLVVPTLMPLCLKEFGLSNAMIGLLVGGIPAMVNVFANPFFGFRSDRLRTAIGRRKPFILIGIPGLALSLMILGMLPLAAPAVAQACFNWFSPRAFLLVATAFFLVLFQVFNNMGMSTFFYLCADVVPGRLIGKFMSILMLFNAAGGFFFSYVMMPLADRMMPLVFIAEGLLLLIAFGVVFWKVREGRYPLPPPKDGNFIEGVRSFFRECFSCRFYVLLFLGFAINDVSTLCRGNFSSIFAQTLDMDLTAIGRVLGYGTIVSAFLSIPLSFLVDRIKPLRVYMGGAILIVLVNIWSFFYVDSSSTYTVAMVAAATVYALQTASQLPCYVALFPKNRYGQFSAANAIFSTGLVALFSYGSGQFIDWMGEYRYMYAWDAVFTAVGVAILVLVYRGWKRYGGPNNFVSPVEFRTQEATRQEEASV